MTVYNDLRFLDAAIDSVLNQDLADIELIVVDDGTGLHDRFATIAQRDPRIKVVVNPSNLGTAAAANRGIEVARADVIARLDADDIAEPTQLSRLWAALSEDPELGLVGSGCSLIDEADRIVGTQSMPQSDLEIRWTILFHNPFYHSTTAYRRSCFEAAGRYRPEELVSQDHYLWFEMLPHCRARNLADPLVRYRVNSRGLTATNAVNARARTHRIREVLWGRLGLSYDLYDDELASDITQFLRGHAVAPARRSRAYRKLLMVLRAFLASGHARENFDDAKKIKRAIVARLFDESPPGLYPKLELAYSCWRVGIYTAAAVMIARLWARTCDRGSGSNGGRTRE